MSDIPSRMCQDLLDLHEKKTKGPFEDKVNKKEDMKYLIKLGVDGIITDYPDKLSEILNRPI